MMRSSRILAATTLLALLGGCPLVVPDLPGSLAAVSADRGRFVVSAPASTNGVDEIDELIGCWGSVQQDGPVITTLALQVSSDGATELAWSIEIGAALAGAIVQRGTLAAEGDGRLRFDLSESLAGNLATGVLEPVEAGTAAFTWRVRRGADLIGVEFVGTGGPENVAGRTLWFASLECMAP